MEQKGLSSDKIVKAYKAISRHVVSGARGRAPAWPFSILETTIFYSKFFTQELLKTMRRLEERGLKREEIAKLFYGPSADSHWLYLAGFPFEGLTRKEVIDFIERTIDIIEFWRKKDIFCVNWRNIIWNSEEIRRQLKRIKLLNLKENDPTSGIIGKINTIAWHYCILIQVGHRNYSHEFHGPYQLGGNKVLLVRDYFNLKPKEVWPFARKLPFDKIRILEVYKNLEIKLDMFNHIWASSSLTSQLRQAYIEIDDSAFTSKREFNDLLQGWIDVIDRANGFVKDYKKEDWVRQVIKMKFWLLKPHKEILGKDWQAPESVLALSKQWQEVELLAQKAIRGQMSKIVGYSEKEAMENITQMYLDNIYKGKMYF